MSFNPNEHLMQLKSKEGAKDYLPVQFRIVWFRELCPNGTIDTEEIVFDLDREVTVEAYVWNNEKRKSEKVLKTAKGYARFKATVADGKGGRATGHGSECAADFSDFGEKAETKAIGRALAGLGYGTQFAPEFDEEHRIVDAPVERPQTNAPTVQGENGAIKEDVAVSPITEQQINSIRKLCPYVKRDIPENLEQMGYLEAKLLIQQLSSEYNTLKAKNNKAS